jgi:hypothetical protein
MSWIDQRERSSKLARRRGYRWWTTCRWTIYDLENNSPVDRAYWLPTEEGQSSIAIPTGRRMKERPTILLTRTPLLSP